MNRTQENAGKVYLLGAGPGDPGLLTVKAADVIEQADVVLYDSLVSGEIRDRIPVSATAIDVGKRPVNGKRTTQDEINELLVEHARSGADVARLKGGDPTVYGRGGEEAQHLADAEIPFEIVPGVTSVTAAPGVVGIPLTHRDHASALTVITGHEAVKEESALDWGALADMVTSGGTLVVLMGVRTLPQTIDRLSKADVAEDTPVAMIERATWSDERTVSGTLQSIVGIAEEDGISSPAVTVIGDVVDVRDDVRASLAREDVLHGESTSIATYEEEVPIPVSQQ